MATLDLDDLLVKAMKSPKALGIKDKSAADAVVLSMHCLMVQAGFFGINGTDGSDGKGIPIKDFSPPALWRQHELEWILPYRRDGALSIFMLRCSLQEATGRLFVHCSELGNDGMPKRENIQVLGLQLANYCTADRCSSNSWEGVIQNESTLVGMFKEFILEPLWEAAEKVLEDEILEESDAEEEREAAAGWGRIWTDKTAMMYIVGGAAVASAAAYLILRRRK